MTHGGSAHSPSRSVTVQNINVLTLESLTKNPELKCYVRTFFTVAKMSLLCFFNIVNSKHTNWKTCLVYYVNTMYKIVMKTLTHVIEAHLSTSLAMLENSWSQCCFISFQININDSELCFISTTKPRYQKNLSSQV